MNDELKTLEHVKQTAVDLALLFGPKLLVALALFVAGMVAGHWVSKIVDGGLRKLHLEPPVRQLLVRVIRILVLGLFLIMALQNLGVQLLPLIAGLGVAGAGVALAMQGVLGNLVAGLTVIFTKPFGVGEYISIAGEEGQVENISLFSTILGHPDLSRVVIPNRKIVGEILHNYGKIRQVSVSINVAADADISGALSALADMLQKIPSVLKDPAPVVAVGLRMPGAIELSVRPWVNVADYGPAGSDIARAIVESFRARNIAAPVPQREVRLLGATEREAVI